MYFVWLLYPRSERQFFKAKSCSALLRTLLVCTSIYLVRVWVLRYNFKLWIPVNRTSCFYVSMDVIIFVCFSKPKWVREYIASSICRSFVDYKCVITGHIHYYYYYYYYHHHHHHHRISHFPALAGKYSPILGCSNQQD